MSRAADARAGEDLLAAHFEPLKEEILRAVAGRLRHAGNGALNRHDLEDAYLAGWDGVLQCVERGEEIKSVAGLVHRITYFRAIDICRQRQRDRQVELDVEHEALEVDMAARLDDQQTLRRLFERLRERLTEKERRAVALCLLHGYTRPEAAELLGVEPARFERTMDRATKKLAGVVAGLQARGCGDEEWASVIRAYALGSLPQDSPDQRRAEEHLGGPDGCEACRRYARGLQAILPPLVPVRHTGWHTGLFGYVRRLLRATTASAPSGGAASAGTAGSGTLGTAIGGAGSKAVLVLGAAAAVAIGTASHSTHKRAPARSTRSRPALAVILPPPMTPAPSRPERHSEPAPKRSGHLARPAVRGARLASSVASRGASEPGEFNWERAATPAPKRHVTVTSVAAATRRSAPAGAPNAEFGIESPR